MFHDSQTYYQELNVFEHTYRIESKATVLFNLFFTLLIALSLLCAVVLSHLGIYKSFLALIIYIPLAYLAYIGIYSIANKNFTEIIKVSSSGITLHKRACHIMPLNKKTCSLDVNLNFKQENILTNDAQPNAIFENKNIQNSSQHAFSGIDRQGEKVKFGANIPAELEQQVTLSIEHFKNQTIV
jgi:hypothetical protein